MNLLGRFKLIPSLGSVFTSVLIYFCFGVGLDTCGLFNLNFGNLTVHLRQFILVQCRLSFLFGFPLVRCSSRLSNCAYKRKVCLDYALVFGSLLHNLHLVSVSYSGDRFRC